MGGLLRGFGPREEERFFPDDAEDPDIRATRRESVRSHHEEEERRRMQYEAASSRW